MEVEDHRDQVIYSLLALLCDYKATCDAYETELETQLQSLSLENDYLRERLKQTEAGYEQLRVKCR